MPVKTRQQVQTPIPFKCRKTRNSSKTPHESVFQKCPADGLKKSTINKTWTDEVYSRGQEQTSKTLEQSSTPHICVSPVRSRGHHQQVRCRSTQVDSAMQSDEAIVPSSPRKRTLLKEVSTNDERPLTPICSPRKVKKENIPISCTNEDNPIDTKEFLKQCTRTRLSNGTDLKSLSSSHHLTKTNSACKEIVCSLSPSSKRKASLADQSLSVTPPPLQKRSPTKTVTPLMLERAEGECYRKTKQALHTALPERLLCRDKELGMMTSFLKSHVTKAQAGSLYISGAPGTGKTACLSQVLNSQKKLMSKAQSVFVNCMVVRHSQGIYGKILDELNDGHQSKISAKDATRKLQKTFTSAGPMVVLVLDEIDHLDSKGQEVLYTMFEWPSLPKSRLILIGVANALDLTDRILPRLQARPKCKPELLNFPPYSKDQIASILLDRIQNISDEGVVEPLALQLCARKVAAVAGDIRKALDVCRRAVEIVECDVKSQLRFGCKSPGKEHGPTTCKVTSSQPVLKKVGLKQVSSVISEVYGSRLATNSNQSQTFPLQQKLMICTVLLMVRGCRTKEILLGKCHESYSKLCKDRRVPAVEQSEFLSLCQLVESRGVIGLKYSKDTRQSKISLKLNESDVETALQDKVLLSSILQGDALKKK